MAEQNRSLWYADYIAEGVALITDAPARGATGPYQLQAAIHDEAPSAEAADWPQIMALYELLMRISDNPMVALNHAVAVAMTRGAHAGLDLLGNLEVDERIAGDHRLHAVRAHYWKCSATTWRRATPTRRRPSEQQASRNSATSTPEPPAEQTTSEPFAAVRNARAVVGREEFPAPSGRSWVNDMPCQPRRSETSYSAQLGTQSMWKLTPYRSARTVMRSQVGHPPSARIWAIDRRAR
jgi:hypothetical protein